jgi:hypothetical protein
VPRLSCEEEFVFVLGGGVGVGVVGFDGVQDTEVVAAVGGREGAGL